MNNMIQLAKDQVLSLTQAAYAAAVAAGTLPEVAEVKANVEIPKDTANGDYTTTFALAAAKAMKKNPREIANTLLENLKLEGTYFASAEIAGPGFLNFRLAPAWYQALLETVEREGEHYGKNDSLQGQKVMVEFVSANPTGPMHMGNARGGVLGDSLANVLKRAGFDTWKEFYVNDAGNQIHKFAESIHARYMQILLGEEGFPFPENGYHGDDIKELAQGFYEQHGDAFKDADEAQWLEPMSQYGLSVNIPKMKSDLSRYQIEYDEWFFESTLHNSGYVAQTVQMLADNGWTYEKDGALWLNTTELLKKKFLAEGKTLCERRGQPDPQVRRVHSRPLHADPPGGGGLPLPRERLSRGRHQGAGPGLL